MNDTWILFKFQRSHFHLNFNTWRSKERSDLITLIPKKDSHFPQTFTYSLGKILRREARTEAGRPCGLVKGHLKRDGGLL